MQNEGERSVKTDIPTSDESESESSSSKNDDDDEPISLQDQYADLWREYGITCQVTSGCGARAQIYIDDAWAAIVNFYDKHPGAALTPAPDRRAKARCYDDGTSGMASGMAAAADTCRQQ